MNNTFSLIDLTCDSRFDFLLLEISNLTLGKGHITNLDLYRGTNGVIVGSLGDKKDKINGFCAGRVLNREEFKKEFKFEFNEFDSFGVIDPVCVHPDYQRMGIGSALIDKVLKNLNAPVFVSPVWSFKTCSGEQSTNAGKSFENAGFKSEFSSSQFWKDECGINFQCPLKNSLDDCNCGINFYVKHNYGV